MTRFCSIFNQLLQLFPRTEFQRAVQQTKAERHARGFACWDQFVAMPFCQLGRAHSLREICGGLASCEGKLTHLGIQPPRRATLAYANAHRPWWEIARSRGRPTGGSLKVVTTRLRQGYLRLNGVPYSGETVLTEHFNRTTEDNGDSWLFVTTIVQDPRYLTAGS